MNLLQKFFKVIYRKPKHIIIVSGLPRSGTSMMMQVLKAGGIEPVTDNERMPDQDNSKGYYEHNGAKALAKGQYDCLVNAEGRSVKVVSTLLKHLPSDCHYKVIFMHRDLDEVLASQTTMLKNLQQEASSEVADDKLKTLYIKHINTVEKWLKESANIDWPILLFRPIQLRVLRISNQAKTIWSIALTRICVISIKLNCLLFKR